MNYYTNKCYVNRDMETRPSAEAVIPHIMDVLPVRSVIDIGCGVGTWLSVFKAYGVSEVFGVEGDWVDKRHFVIPEQFIMHHDLSKPFQLNKKFNLAMSLEVAEHLPKECAQMFVRALTQLAPAVLFAAAIPGQGGIGHFNEQWPDYWLALFKEEGFVAMDCIRNKIWDDERVEWWYAQNTLLYVKRELVQEMNLLERMPGLFNLSQLRIVHPKNYENVLTRASFTYLAKRIIKKVILPGRT